MKTSNLSSFPVLLKSNPNGHSALVKLRRLCAGVREGSTIAILLNQCCYLGRSCCHGQHCLHSSAERKSWQNCKSGSTRPSPANVSLWLWAAILEQAR